MSHDYNYAQVLTIDLLAQGFRYAEVPMSYAFRTEGESFVRLVPYLRHVVPAVWRLHREYRSRSVLDDVAPEPVAGGEPRPGVEPAV